MNAVFTCKAVANQSFEEEAANQMRMHINTLRLVKAYSYQQHHNKENVTDYDSDDR